jgi:uncharacterized protein
MSNKKTVEEYMDAFAAGDNKRVLDCLTDDVVWIMPGFFHLAGKEQFNKEINNDAFEGIPAITTIRLVEEGNIVVAEGEVQCKIKNGGMLDAVFCDVFHFENGKINQLTSYLMNKVNVQR